MIYNLVYMCLNAIEPSRCYFTVLALELPIMKRNNCFCFCFWLALYFVFLTDLFNISNKINWKMTEFLVKTCISWPVNGFKSVIRIETSQKKKKNDNEKKKLNTFMELYLELLSLALLFSHAMSNRLTTTFV